MLDYSVLKLNGLAFTTQINIFTFLSCCNSHLGKVTILKAFIDTHLTINLIFFNF